MANPTCLTKTLSYIALLTCLLYACNNNKSAKTGSSKQTPTFYLDSLIVSTDAFKAIGNQNITFSYFLGDTSVTLYGWVLKKGKRPGGGGGMPQDTGSYNPTADLILTPVGKTTVAVGPNTFIGNQVLLKKQVSDLVRFIGTRKGNLLFVPMLDATNRTIKYRITWLSKIASDTSMFDNEFLTNPAPPHQAYD
ncbi:hypothetical protein JYG30_01775 [Fibrella sp. USSR17]